MQGKRRSFETCFRARSVIVYSQLITNIHVEGVFSGLKMALVIFVIEAVHWLITIYRRYHSSPKHLGEGELNSQGVSLYFENKTKHFLTLSGLTIWNGSAFILPCYARPVTIHTYFILVMEVSHCKLQSSKQSNVVSRQDSCELTIM